MSASSPYFKNVVNVGDLFLNIRLCTWMDQLFLPVLIDKGICIYVCAEMPMNKSSGWFLKLMFTH